jgi:hypothetical protein
MNDFDYTYIIRVKNVPKSWQRYEIIDWLKTNCNYYCLENQTNDTADMGVLFRYESDALVFKLRFNCR